MAWGFLVGGNFKARASASQTRKGVGRLRWWVKRLHDNEQLWFMFVLSANLSTEQVAITRLTRCLTRTL